MKIEIRQFIGIATAETGNRQNYPIGDRHAVNLFLAQEIGSAPDWTTAESIIAEANWSNIELRKTGIVLEEKAFQSKSPLTEMYKAAMTSGSALLIYSTIES